MKSLPWIIVATALIGSILQAVLFWPQLPNKVASHFNGAGQPDGWMSKTNFVAMTLLLQFGLAAMMFGIGWLVRVLPPSMINIPNKEYWLAGERRDQTLNDSAAMMAWIAAGTAVFMMVIFYFSFDANVGEKNGLNSTATWIAVVIYLVWLTVYCVMSLKKYYSVPAR